MYSYQSVNGMKISTMPPTKSGELSFVHLADAAGTVIGIYTD